jgi:predicted PurR-regulated permease PerM
MPDATANDWGSRSHVQTLVLLVATAFGIYLCYRLAVPFMPPLAWALGLAVLFTPFQRWVESKLKHPRLAAFVSVMVIGLIVVVPLTFVGQRLIMQAAQGAALIDAKVTTGEWRRSLEAQPSLAPIADRIERQIDLPGTVKSFAAWLGSYAGTIVTGSMHQAIDFCLTFYLLFFFLRDRRAGLQTLKSLSPLTGMEMDRIFSRISNTIHATIYGTLAVAAVQGLLGGLMFWWLGLPAPLLWGVVMAFMALVPVLGAFVIWIPAAFFLVLEGSWGKALILTLWGLVVVGTIDNLLRPMLVGRRLKLHTILAFISVVGGLIQFGPAGLIIGPAVLAITTALLEVWTGRNLAELGSEPGELHGFEKQGGLEDAGRHPPVPIKPASCPPDKEPVTSAPG